MRKYYRFVEGFRRFAKQGTTPEEAIALAKSSIKKRVAARDENFLNFVEKGVFQYSSSPYLKLLELKRIHFDDLKNWVAKDGIKDHSAPWKVKVCISLSMSSRAKSRWCATARNSGARRECSTIPSS